MTHFVMCDACGAAGRISSEPPWMHGATHDGRHYCSGACYLSDADNAEGDLQLLQLAVWGWSDVTFGRSTPDGALAHLANEADELFLNSSTPEEYADCLLLLLDAARFNRISARMIVAAAWAKMGVNRERTWGEVNAQGFSEHVE